MTQVMYRTQIAVTSNEGSEYKTYTRLMGIQIITPSNNIQYFTDCYHLNPYEHVPISIHTIYLHLAYLTTLVAILFICIMHQ